MPHKDPEARKAYARSYNAVRKLRRHTDPEYRSRVNRLGKETRQRRWADDPDYREQKRAELRQLPRGNRRQKRVGPFAFACRTCGYQFMDDSPHARICNECRVEMHRRLNKGPSHVRAARRQYWGLAGSPEKRAIAEAYFALRDLIREQGR
jgi:hypothetical protein